jgi:23S rRNA pseudouridine2605 synthase
MIRLNKWIAQSGICSRREADRLIEAGQVTVNGRRVMTLGESIDPVKDVVAVNGKPLSQPKRYYLLFHKPTGIITTRSDEKGRKTIYDLLPQEYHDADPAGRLDRDSSGALILSNNGDFIHKVTHPSFHLPKRYRVTLNRPIHEDVLKRLLKGVMLQPENKKAIMTAIEVEAPTVLLVTLVTGYNRQIRRSLEIVGYQVETLKRVAVGNVSLGQLKPGRFRHLTPQELSALGWRETRPRRPG